LKGSKALLSALLRAGSAKMATCHTLRHSFETHLIEDDYDIPAVQGLLGHKDAARTIVYTHVSNKDGRGVKIPFDHLEEALAC